MITRKPNSSLKARLVVSRFERSAAGSATQRITDSVTTRSTTLFDGDRISENAGVQSQCHNGFSARFSWRSRAPLWDGGRTFTSIGLGTSPVRKAAKVSVRADRRHVPGGTVEKETTSQRWGTLTTEPCFEVKTSSEGRVHGLAIAYVDDFMTACDEESEDGLAAMRGVREQYDGIHSVRCSNCAELSSKSLEWSLTVVCKCICHQPEESNVTIHQPLGNCELFGIWWDSICGLHLK